MYLLHPPGGVVGGDHLRIEVEVNPGAHALITTPAAGKFYRSAGLPAQQRQTLKVAAEGTLEWFPLETIIFSGARVDAATKIELASSSRFIGWDILCFGRPACGEHFDRGVFDQRFEVWLDGAPLRMERVLVSGGGPILDAKWGLAGYPVMANMICVAPHIPHKALADKIRQIKAPLGESLCLGVTHVDGAILCRFLGNHVEQAKKILIEAWEILRLDVMRQKAVPPRIWNT